MHRASVPVSLLTALLLSVAGVSTAFAQDAAAAPTAKPAVATAVSTMSAPAAKAAPARCRDAKGHYAKCPVAAAKKSCRDAKGRFIACAR